MDRPVTTLFMLMSLDGKISTGASDELDVDKDFVDIVIAPVLIDGNSIISRSGLKDLGVLKLIDCTVLEDSYLRVRYQVIS